MPATVTYYAATRTATLTPTRGPSRTCTLYTATVKSGANGVKDAAGNPLASDFVWTFTTVADTTAPTVSERHAARMRRPTWRGDAVTATFSEAMTAASISADDGTADRPGDDGGAGDGDLRRGDADGDVDAERRLSPT